MLITLATYREGTQAAYVVQNPRTRKISIMHEDKKGYTQFPVKYADGRIAYDYPERVTPYGRILVSRAFVAADVLAFARRNCQSERKTS